MVNCWNRFFGCAAIATCCFILPDIAAFEILHPHRALPVRSILRTATRGEQTPATTASCRRTRQDVVCFLQQDTADDADNDKDRPVPDLIRTLSLCTDDAERRARLVAVFEARGYQSQFCSAFDASLVELGDRVRQSAPEEATATTQAQLWALVDMMVQSKTIVKRAAGQLGSEGTFG